jgi:tetratricopeptide (TPR) repeat protein
VAVKVLSPALLESADATLRFRRELQLARKVTHPNVCRLYDLGRHTAGEDALLFLTMELVEGGTLADRLKAGGRFTPEEAEPVLRQLLAGLSAAHQAGVVHRDLKPSNIMLTPGRAVIMDFGLARREAADASLTSSGKVIGTLDYMAPEQLRGEPATERTDLYAFGLIGYEMLLDQRPFGSADSFSAGVRRLTGNPPVLPRDLGASRNMVHVIQSCLQRNSSERPPSAARAIEILEGKPLPVRIPRRQLMRAAAVTVTASLAGWAWTKRPPANSGGTAAVPNLLVIPVENLTGEPRIAGISTLLTRQLDQSPDVALLPESRLSELRSRMGRAKDAVWTPAIAREAALRNGGTAILLGQVTKMGEDYLLSLKLEAPGSRPDERGSQWNRAFPATGDQALMAAVRTASAWVRETLGENTESFRLLNRSPLEVTTPSWDALAAYDQARAARARNQWTEAESFLRESVRIDPDFAAANQELADLLTSSGRYREGYVFWGKAVSIARKRNLTDRERFRMEGLYLDDGHDYQAAERAYAAWSARYPKDWIPLYYRGTILGALGRSEEAIHSLEASYRLNPFPDTARALARLSQAAGERDAANRWRNSVKGDSESDGLTDAILAFMRGAYGDATALFEKATAATADSRDAISGLRIAACAWADLGAPLRAIELLTRGIQASVAAGDRAQLAGLRIGSGFCHWQSGNLAGAREQLWSAIQADPSPRFLLHAARLARLIEDPAALTEIRKLVPAIDAPICRYLKGVLAVENALLRKDWSEAAVQARAVQSPSQLWTPPVSLWEAGLRLSPRGAAPGLVLASPAWLWQAVEHHWPGLWRHVLTLCVQLDGGPLAVAARERLARLKV